MHVELQVVGSQAVFHLSVWPELLLLLLLLLLVVAAAGGRRC